MFNNLYFNRPYTLDGPKKVKSKYRCERCVYIYMVYV